MQKVESSCEDALKVLSQQGIAPSRDGMYHLVQECGRRKKDIAGGRKLQYLMLCSRFQSVACLADHVIRIFADCGSLFEASLAFCRVSQPSVYTWHALISAHSQLGQRETAFQLFCQMHDVGIMPDKVTILCILRACNLPKDGMLLHEEIITYGLEADLAIMNTLLDMYMKLGDFENAQMIFDSLRNRDLVSWTVMIAGYTQHGCSHVALELYDDMHKEGLEADKVACSAILKVCGNLGDLKSGKLIHESFIRKGNEVDSVIGNTLIDMYGKCGALEEALKVFDVLPSRDVVSWSSMIVLYGEQGKPLAALELYGKMLEEGIIPDAVTLICSLKACSNIGALEKGQLLHGQVIEKGIECNVGLGNTLIDMYAKCGNLEDADCAFIRFQNKDLVSWNAIITGYGQHDKCTSVLYLFCRMQQVGIRPDKVTLLCTLKACIGMGSLWEGRLIHDKVLRMELDSDLIVGNAILDMYTKCGSLGEAKRVFDNLSKKDSGSWGAIILAYVEYGNHKLAVEHLKAMQEQGLKPLARTFTSIFTACSHTGLLEEGSRLFKAMNEDHGITPNDEHLNCIIDLLGRAGCLSVAEELLQSTPSPPNATGLTSLLAACRTYKDAELGKRCFDHAVLLDPSSASAYALMSSMYIESHKQNELQEIAQLQQRSCAWKKPGKAWIEINEKMLEFTKGNQLLADNIFFNSMRFARCWNFKYDYIPMVDLILDSNGIPR